ncbi:hypothetical protein PHMEG_00038266 [Phytophthora megakarya]|uniref:Reverse transcriptase n=1 Tax=Phytophthora megakarya TaxID=4795 RepID=A0A225UHI3_9STRA|nr:hypothetical protein PHMEG_00038266 [Phytophthora megakarya]
MLQTITRVIKMYITDNDQRDWDEYAERLIYALIWLYLDRVKPGYARKLAHVWHGPFRVAELVSAYAVRLETNGTPYQLFPIVHVSELKPVREFPSRPELQLTVSAEERFDFDEELLPEDSWETHDADDDAYEVEQILDVREGRTTSAM